MTMFIETPALVAQSVAETAGGAETGGVLAGAAAPLGAVLPQGGEEASAALAAAIEAHAAQFLPVATLGVAQRELFADTVLAGNVAYLANEAANAVMTAAVAVV